MGSKFTGLVVSPVFPLPANTGALVRILNLAQGLNKNFDITFVSPLPSLHTNIDLDSMNRMFCNPIFIHAHSDGLFNRLEALFSLLPYHVDLYYSEGLKQKITNLIQQNNYSFIFCNFIYTLIYFSNLKKDIPIYVDQHNVDTEYWLRKVENSNNIIEKYLSYVNLKKTVHFEKKWLQKIKGYISVSNFDRQKTIQYAYPTVQNFIVAPNGVDINQYHIRSANQNLSRKIVIGFMGSMDLKINQEAVVFLVRKIIPALRRNLPDYDFHVLVIGRNPPKFIQEMAVNDEAIEITGTVNTVGPYLEKIDIFVCPLFGGAGTKLRLFEAMATGLPIVGSPQSFEGIDEIKSGCHAYVAQEVEQYVKYISRLASNPDLRLKMGMQARQLVEQKYSWDQITSQLSQNILDSLNQNG